MVFDVCIMHSTKLKNLFLGLPELRSAADIQHLQNTLGLKSDEKDMCEEELEKAALKKFRKNFDDAYKNSTSTSLNWAIHMWARDNK